MIIINHPDILYLFSDEYRNACRVVNPGHEKDEFHWFDLMVLSAIYEHVKQVTGCYIYIPRLFEIMYGRMWKKSERENFIASLADSIWKWGTVKGFIEEGGRAYPVTGSADDSILYCYDFDRHWQTKHIHVAFSNIMKLLLKHGYYVEIKLKSIKCKEREINSYYAFESKRINKGRIRCKKLEDLFGYVV